MIFVNRTVGTSRRMWRPAFMLVFLAQFVVALSPLLEGRDGPDARAHVEEAGTRIHHAHDEAYCSACTVRHLLASAATVPPAVIVAIASTSTLAVEHSKSFKALAGSPTRSRAPPAEL
jgi:hypothetical protein